MSHTRTEAWKHTPCNNLVVHPLRNEILTENGCETMFFDEGSMKLKLP